MRRKANSNHPRAAGKEDDKLGQKIKALRIASKQSQDELGAAIGVSFQQVQKYEKGTNRVSHVRLEQIAKALGCTMGDFLTEGYAKSAKGDQLIGFINDPFLFRIVKATHTLPRDVQTSIMTLCERLAANNVAA